VDTGMTDRGELTVDAGHLAGDRADSVPSTGLLARGAVLD
jgi:hypothetical protein